MYLATLTDEELARYAEAMKDDLLSSQLEIELTKRFRQMLDRGVKSSTEQEYERPSK